MCGQELPGDNTGLIPITLMRYKAALAALGLLVVILMMSLQQRLSMFIAVMVLPERLLPL